MRKDIDMDLVRKEGNKNLKVAQEMYKQHYDRHIGFKPSFRSVTTYFWTGRHFPAQMREDPLQRGIVNYYVANEGPTE